MNNKENQLREAIKWHLQNVEDTTTGLYRCIVELSSMSNNDEVYLTFQTESKSVLEQTILEMLQILGKDSQLFSPRIVLIRPIYLSELTDRPEVPISIAESDTTHQVMCTTLCTKRFFYDRHHGILKPKDITEVFDTFQKVKNQLAFYDLIHEQPTTNEHTNNTRKLAEVVAYILGTEYYDCMSGGMPTAYINLCYFILNRLGQEVHEMYVYPKSPRNNDTPRFKDKDHVCVEEFLDEFRSGHGYDEKYQLLFAELANQFSKQHKVFAPLYLEA